MLKDGYLADMPIVIAAIDPCFSCTDRLISVKHEADAAADDELAVAASIQHRLVSQTGNRFFRNLNRETFKSHRDDTKCKWSIHGSYYRYFRFLFFRDFCFSAVFGLAAEYFDRKLCAKLQNRVGPPWYQPVADFIKLAAKEDIIPENADTTIFQLMPVVALDGGCDGLHVYPDVGHTGAVFIYRRCHRRALSSDDTDVHVLSRRLVFAKRLFDDRCRPFDYAAFRV